MGALLKGPLSPEVVDYFSSKVFEMSGSIPTILQGPFHLAYNQVVRLFHREAPAPLAEEIDALAAGMGVDAIVVRRAITLPDTGAALNTLLHSAAPSTSSGCTSLARKSGGRFVYGRNLDFPGAGVWDKHPLVTILIPEKGSPELRHVSFGADGVLFGGITGVNEAGITFAVQQNYTRDAGLRGVPMMLIGELVLRQAHSLAEAEAILRRYRPAVLWTFVLTDLKTGEAMAVETSQDHFSLRREVAGTLVQTNHLMNEELKKNEELVDVGNLENSIYRMKVAESLLSGAPAEVEKAASVLSYQANPDEGLTAYHDVMKAHTIQTVIFSAQDGRPEKVYVSHEEAPAAGGEFVAFDFQELLGGSPSNYELAKLTHPTPLQRQRQVAISRAFHSYFDQGDITKALSLLADQNTLDAALFRAVAHYQLGYYGEALALADDSLLNPRFRGEPTYILQSMKGVKLASLWQLDRRADALTFAEQLAAERPENERLRELAEKVAQGERPSKRLLKIRFDFFSGDISGR
jgi:hypothetical protein